jgi:hypothetical protein
MFVRIVALNRRNVVMAKGSRFSRLVPAVGAVSVTTAFIVGLGGPAFAASPAPFTAGDVAIYRVGTGTGALTSAGTAAFIDEYSSSGSLVQSIPLPTAVNGLDKPLVASGTATSEGQLSLSVDGQYLLATGYDATPGTASVAGTTSTAVPRVVGRIDGNGNIDTTTALTDALSGNNPRTAVSTDGTHIWIGGANGVNATTLGSTTSSLLSSQNTRQLGIFNSQLYLSSSSGTNKGVNSVGTGLPTSGTQTLTLLAGSASAYGYAFVTLGSGSTPDTLYVADSTTTAGNASILKFGLSSGTWVAEGSISVAVGTLNLEGLAVSVSNGVATLFATSGAGTSTGGGSLYTATDSTGAGGTASGSAPSIATASANETFRGVAFVPGFTGAGTGTPEVPIAVVLPIAGALLLGGTFYVSRRRSGNRATPVAA